MAQESAQKCAWNPGQVMSSDQFEYVGQNLAYKTSKHNAIKSPVSMIERWYQEKNNYDADADTCASGKMCRGYTQVSLPTSKGLCIQLAESQKGVNAVQQCSVENQKAAIAIDFV